MTEYLVPVAAGIFVSLFNKYILNNPSIETCCQPEAEEVDAESDISNNTDITDAMSRVSGITSSILTPPHQIHCHHGHY
jgi:hypothetical protein